MARGRKPKADHLKLVQGNPGKRTPATKGKGNAPALRKHKIPAPPQYLDAEAKREWNRAIVELVTRGKYCAMFRTELAKYCASFSRWRLAEKKLKGGLIIKSPKGYEIQSPWLAISNKAREQMDRLAVEFGFTPVSHIRVQGAQFELFSAAADEKTGTDDPWDGF
jgi:P27 family predicted phage terminase small subunit|tara:strand:- start:9219 stop:9713 length:495 start_codon:yes stop_codon:yes gene_type:complete